MAVVALEALNPREYEHPLDQKALNTLENTKGLDVLVRKFYELGIEKMLRIQYTGSNIRATSNNLPRLYHLLEEVCDTLYLKEVPDLYLQRGDKYEALTWGVEKPIIVLDAGAANELSDDELRFVLGKEIGHIKSEHMLYAEIGWLLPIISEALAGATLGLSLVLSTALRMALINWMRMASYTSDRAGLLACQDVRVATRMLMKIAGLPKNVDEDLCIDEFITQAREFEGYNVNTFSKVIKFAGVFFSERPWTIARANQFFAWTDSGDYQRVLKRETRIVSTPPPPTVTPPAPEIKFCPECGFKLQQVVSFCPNCGHKLSN